MVFVRSAIGIAGKPCHFADGGWPAPAQDRASDAARAARGLHRRGEHAVFPCAFGHAAGRGDGAVLRGAALHHASGDTGSGRARGPASSGGGGRRACRRGHHGSARRGLGRRAAMGAGPAGAGGGVLRGHAGAHAKSSARAPQPRPWRSTSRARSSSSVLGFWTVAGDGRYSAGFDGGPMEFLLRAWIWPRTGDIWIFVLLGFLSAGIGYSLSQALQAGHGLGGGFLRIRGPAAGDFSGAG